MKLSKNLYYIIFAVATAIIFVSMIIWSSLGVSAGEVKIYEVPLVLAEDVQTEYLVGQSFNPEGISLNIGKESKPELIDASECTIDADFSSGGNKRVAINWSPNETTSYIGYLNVYVYFVRGLEVAVMPSSITVAEDGTFTCDEDFEVHAYLTSMPKNTEKFAPADEDGSSILLTPDMYTAKAVESKQTPGCYTGSIYCGNLTYSFNFYNDAERTFLISSERSVVMFENSDESSAESLTLIVTDAPDSYQHTGVGKTVGSYIYTDADGDKSVLDFAYEMTETEEIFSSEGLGESHEDDIYTVEYEGNTFNASANIFQSAVVNGIIVDDGGQLFVVGSRDRICDFRYIPTESYQEGDPVPELKVYVTYYVFTMDNGSGVAEGFYLYTDLYGNKYRIPFFMQTWVWDIVPLSATKNTDPFLSALDYLLKQYDGDIHTEIKIFSDYTKDWINDNFEANFGDIRFAAYNF